MRRFFMRMKMKIRLHAGLIKLWLIQESLVSLAFILFLNTNSTNPILNLHFYTYASRTCIRNKDLSFSLDSHQVHVIYEQNPSNNLI